MEAYYNVKQLEKLWAKKNAINGILYWLPLKQHLLDTMMVIDLLWEHWLSQSQRLYIVNASNVKEEYIIKKIVKFIGITHDLGKATPAFQIMSSFSNTKDLDVALIEQLELAGIRGLSNHNLISRNKTPHALASQVLLSSFGVNEGISSIIGAHHGKVIDRKSDVDNQLIVYEENYYNGGPLQAVWKEIHSALFAWCLSKVGISSVEEIPTITQTGLVLLSGLLIMADWIASNENYFPYFELGKPIVFDKNKRILTGWNKWHIDSNWVHEKKDISTLYQERFGFNPRSIQNKMSEIINDLVSPGIIILEAPMGIGKTEAALVAAEQLMPMSQIDGLYFGLPTQATSNGIFSRVKDWLASVSMSDNSIKSIQLVHAKAYLNDSYRDLKYQNNSNYSKEEGQVLAHEWFTGRKTALLDSFVVGTVDHLLMLALKQRHLALRHLGFSNKIVIIDEVHAYDAYMNQYLYQAIKWLGAYNIPVIVLSATLPIDRRNKLVKSYLQGSGYKFSHEVVKPKQWETESSYPLITYTDENKIYQKINLPIEFVNTVAIKKVTDEQIKEIVIDFLNCGGIIGIVLNTVKRVQSFAKDLLERISEDDITILHSGYIASERVKKEDKLVKILGKNGDRPNVHIVIGTQVLEQSLDIDFDVLITDLAPMDLLLQRIGRLHRHTNIARPEQFTLPTAYILGTNESFNFEKGSTNVYGQYLLIRTQYYLPNEIHLPKDISVLVQKIYNDQDLTLDKDLLNIYTKAKEKYIKEIVQKERKAKGFKLLDPNEPNEYSLIGWLKDLIPAESSEAGFAQVRDILDSIEVYVIKKHEDTYRLFDNQEEIEFTAIDNVISKKIAKQTLRLPLVLTMPDKIDQTIKELEQYNLKHLAFFLDNPWLKGALGIILDDNGEFVINGYRLTYDEKLGLEYEKED